MSRSKYKPKRLDNWPKLAAHICMEIPFRRKSRKFEKQIVREKDVDLLVWPERPPIEWWS